MPPKVVRRRVRKVRDHIEIYSFRTRKITKISRRPVISIRTGGNGRESGVEVAQSSSALEDPGEEQQSNARHSRVTEVNQDQFSDR